MSTIAKWLLGVAAVALLLFGLGCLNYTKAGGLEHHRKLAQEHGLPEPSEGILLGGVAALISGSGLLGYLMGARSRAKAEP